jgi:hypothetical protein
MLENNNFADSVQINFAVSEFEHNFYINQSSNLILPGCAMNDHCPSVDLAAMMNTTSTIADTDCVTTYCSPADDTDIMDFHDVILNSMLS